MQFSGLRGFAILHLTALALGWASLLQPAALCAADFALEQILDGFDANFDKIQHGHAIYNVKSLQYLQSGEQKLDDDYEVWFDYPKIRIDSLRGQQRLIVLEDRTINFPAGRLPQLGKLRARDFIVTIFGTQSGPKPLAHPRILPLATYFTNLRRLESDQDSTMEISKGDKGQIVLRVHRPAQAVNYEYFLLPEKGFAVARGTRAYYKPADNGPEMEVDASYEQADNGAYVLSHFTRNWNPAEESDRVPRRRDEITLKEITLKNAPDETLFTLDGLGLPEGARVRNLADKTESIYYAPKKVNGVE